MNHVITKLFAISPSMKFYCSVSAFAFFLRVPWFMTELNHIFFFFHLLKHVFWYLSLMSFVWKLRTPKKLFWWVNKERADKNAGAFFQATYTLKSLSAHFTNFALIFVYWAGCCPNSKVFWNTSVLIGIQLGLKNFLNIIL